MTDDDVTARVAIEQDTLKAPATKLQEAVDKQIDAAARSAFVSGSLARVVRTRSLSPIATAAQQPETDEDEEDTEP